MRFQVAGVGGVYKLHIYAYSKILAMVMCVNRGIERRSGHFLKIVVPKKHVHTALTLMKILHSQNRRKKKT